MNNLSNLLLITPTKSRPRFSAVSLIAVTIAILILGFTPLLLAAEKLSLATHSALIQKLESVISNKDRDTMYKQSQLALRLADLYAERARLLSLENEGKGDIVNKDKIHTDRSQAISIYSKVLSSLKSEEIGRVLLQTAHLHLMMQNQPAAVKVYSGIIKNSKPHTPETLATAQIQMGDILFYKGEFEKSYQLFRSSLAIKQNPRKGYALYRSAWCQFNIGKTKIAQTQLIVLLKNKSLFIKSKVVDTSFQEEVSRDLATFMARNDITSNDIATLSQLSPDSTRQKNLIYLATELDRTAKKRSALLVWNIIGKQVVDFESQLEGQIQITRIQYDLGNKTNLLVEIDRTLALLRSPACQKSEECVLGQQSLKKIITEWGKAEELKPSTELILGFAKYNSQFDDAEMNYWAAHFALKNKLYPEAFTAFKKAAQLFSKLDRTSDARLQRLFEGSLMGAIGAAESSESRNLQLSAYQLYLELNPEGLKRDDIKYQIAHLYYEGNDYVKAAELFRNIALDIKSSTALREKSAELCLDSAVLLKNESQIESDSLLFSQTFKSRKSYYLGLWRKSILNQSAKVINSPRSSNQDLEAQWKKLDNLTSSDWPEKDKKTLIKNKLAIGTQLKDLFMVAQGAAQVLQLDNLTQEEQNWAIAQAAWVAEMRMDFPKALSLLKQVTPKKHQLADHHFKLALLMELAHQNPSSEYLNYMSVSTDSQKRQFAAFQLIRNSQNPKSLFLKYGRVLKANATLYASAGVITFERTQDITVALTVLNARISRGTFESEILARSLELKDFDQLTKKLLSKPLAGLSDKMTQKNLLARIKAIKQLEAKSQKAIQTKDSSLQLIYLAQVAHENSKLVQDILALPTPKQLTDAQKAEYQEQIQLQIKPYLTQAIAVKEKVSELWDMAIKKAIFKDLHDLSLDVDKPGSRLARQEIEKLKVSATLSGLKQNPFINFTLERHKVALAASQLQQSISENPFNFSDIEKFKALQKELGHGPMVAYLESRAEDLHQKGGRN